jgi:hypothetical protein
VTLSDDDKVILFVALKSGAVAQIPAYRGSASYYIRNWWNARSWALVPPTGVPGCPECLPELSAEKIKELTAESVRYLETGTIAHNIGSGEGGQAVPMKEGDKTWAAAAWALSEVVAMWTWDTPGMPGTRIEGDECKDR